MIISLSIVVKDGNKNKDCKIYLHPEKKVTIRLLFSKEN